MNCFFSYASLDWKIVDDSMGDQANGFLACLRYELQQQHGKNFQVFRDKEDLKRGLHFPPGLERLIDQSTVFLFLYSQNWLASSWCWREFDYAVTRIPRIVFVPILFRPFEFDHEKMVEGWEEEGWDEESRKDKRWEQKAVRLHEEVMKVHDPDFLHEGFEPALRRAYGEQDGRRNRMVPFAQRIGDAIRNAVKKPDDTLWRKSMGARGNASISNSTSDAPSSSGQSTVGPLHLAVQGRAVEFVRVPAGVFTCPETGYPHRVDKPFLIMKHAIPADRLLSTGSEPGLTFGDLLAPGYRMGSGPGSIALALPTEDQWDWAMHQALSSQSASGTVSDAAQVVPANGSAKEPVSAVSVPRRAFADMTGPARRRLGLKWVEDGQLRRKTALREDRKLGRTHLRLVAPIAFARVESVSNG